MYHRLNLKILLLICVMLPMTPISAQAPEAYIISMWTFDRAQRYQPNEQVTAEHNQPLNEGILQMRGGDIERSGTEGRPHTDFTCGQRFDDSAAIEWEDVRGEDEERTEDDAQLLLSVSTVDWEVSYLFFYYHSRGVSSFDVSYHLGDENWQLLADDVVIDNDSNWDNIGVDLREFEDLNNRSLVVFLIHDMTRDFGRDQFRMDNIALMGNRISKPNDCPPQVEMIDPLEEIGIVLNQTDIPTYTGDNGFEFQVSDDVDLVEELTILAITTDPNVVNKLALTTVDQANGLFRLDIDEPHGYPGVANIILRVSDSSGNTTEVSLQYGATNLPISPDNNFHQGTADASAGVALDADTMLVANDSDQLIRMYRRTQSGLPLAVFNVTNSLELFRRTNDEYPPVVIESATSVGNRQYWLGSHSNTERGNNQINSYRLFATEITRQGAEAQLTVVGYYGELFDRLHDWSENYGYNFERARERGERTTNPNGFKIEAFTIAPDGQTAYIGMRTPLVPTDNRTNALIIPIQNFEAWFNNGNVNGDPSIGEPIVFDLQGLGIRGMECNTNGCVIAAGAIDNEERFALYTWSGNPQDAPVLRNVDLEGLHPESVILSPDDDLSSGSTVQLVSDSDRIDWYRAGQRGDRLATNLQLFRSNVITLD